MPPRVSAFPKCYLDEIAAARTMSVFEWVEMAKDLDADGLEMYEGFFTSLDSAYLEKLHDAIRTAGFEMPMLCCSPDFTNPSSDARKLAVEHEASMIRVARGLGGPRTVCCVLTGQRYPEVSREQGVEWVVEAITALLPVAREYEIVLGLENHYKDGFWRYPEFAQKQEVFLAVLNAIPEREYFGVQYDPSNAIVAGDHGVTGKGLNDYTAIFRILARHGYEGWISIEDGMNGMDEMAESLAFLRKMIATHYKG
ncbi:MAG: sugar phosphate isomerase/epimerase [Candidatus Solibacter sp.]|nr:sugar phosphate isomerase/epimerase [Candidatus Solibacter sp.]